MCLSVSPSSADVLCEVFPSDSDCENVRTQFSSFSRKRRDFHMESKEDTNVADSAEDAQQLSRRCTQDVDCEVCKSWAAVYQSIARRMLSYLDNSEASKVGAKELEEHVLAPDEPSVNLEHIASRAKGEKRRKCSRSSADREEKRS